MSAPPPVLPGSRRGSLLRVGNLVPLLGALAPACGARAAAAPQQIAFDSARAWAHLERVVGFGERPSGSRRIEELRGYLVSELSTLGLEPEVERFTEDTPAGDIGFANVFADVPAAPEASDPPCVVLATHFDTKRLDVPFVGANDGGSGTAVLLELARVLTQGPPRPVTYRLLFLDGEESFRPRWIGKDNRYGSRHHVEGLVKSGRIESVRACVLLDMVGDRDLRLNYELYSDERLLDLFFQAAHASGLGDHVGGFAREIRDDHQSFLAAGVPSVDLIDFEYGPDNDWWHTGEDTLDKCSSEALDAIGRIVLAGLERLEELLLKRPEELSAGRR